MPWIRGVAAAQDKLEELVGQIQSEISAVAAANDAAAYRDKVLEWVDRLADFRGQTVHEFAEEKEQISVIDKKARDISDELLVTAIGDAVSRLGQLAGEVRTLGAQLNQQALTNLDTAQRQALVPVANALETLVDGIEEIRLAAKRLEEQNFEDQSLLDKMKTLLGEFETLRSAIQNAD